MRDLARLRAIGAALAECRREAGMSQRSLASALGVGVGRVRGWEAGTRDFCMEHFFAVAEAFGIEATELMGRLRDADSGSGEVGFI